MRSVIKYFSVAVVFFGVVGCSSVTPLKPGEAGPITRYTYLDGSYHSSDEFRGKTVVLIFWSTTCAKAGQLMERVSEISARYANRHDVAFLLVSLDKSEDIDKLKEVIHSQHLEHAVHAFSGNEGYDEAFVAYHGDELPQVYVVNPAGVITDAGRDASVIEQGLAGLNQ